MRTKNKESFGFYVKVKMTNRKYAEFKDGKFLFPQSTKKVILTSSFDKNNLGKESFALGKKIHRNKKGGIRTITESILRKEF